MEITDGIVASVRGFLNIDVNSDVFDMEIIPLIQSSIGRLSQNGVAKSSIISTETTWEDIINPDIIAKDEVFSLIPLYIKLSVKMLFDPPPPSTIQFYQSNLDDNLWRLRLICDIEKNNQTEGEQNAL